MIEVKKIIEFLDKDVLKVFGEYNNIKIQHLKPPNNIDEHTLDWISSKRKNKQKIVENSFARVIIVDPDIIYSDNIKVQNKILIQVFNPKLAIAKIGQKFFSFIIKPGIHPSSVINPKAKVGKNIFIGPNSSIGKCSIGNDVIIHSNVTIHDNVFIGNKVIIHSGAVLGSDGFGYVRGNNEKLIKFPQIGTLIVNDEVEIGANTCIDKGALEDTEIGVGTKINNLCHIAHNVKIGKNALITGQVNISGSCIIEDGVWISPNATIRDHIHIMKKAHVGMGAVVTKDIPENETWIGNPAKKINL